MKRIFVSLAVALALVAVMAVPAMAAEETLPASVTVNEYISFTVTDAGTAGINFGSLNPGTSNNPEVNQTATAGAVTLTVGAETNVNCSIQTKGSGDFSGGTHSIALNNAKWDKDSDVTGATAVSTTYATIDTSTHGTAYSQDVWYWLTIPSGQAAGTYTTDFYYQAVAQ